LVSRALANAPPLPLVEGGPVLSKPSSVVIKLHLGFFDIFVEGPKGERAFFRLPLRRAAPSAGCKGLMVANFTTASVGLIDSIVTVGSRHLPSLAVDVLARGSAPADDLQVPLELASRLVLGSASSLAETLATAPSLPALDLPASPVCDTVWRRSTPPPEPRRSSRLINNDSKSFVSIVD
jgi:hypothetical protein